MKVAIIQNKNLEDSYSKLAPEAFILVCEDGHVYHQEGLIESFDANGFKLEELSNVDLIVDIDHLKLANGSFVDMFMSVNANVVKLYDILIDRPNHVNITSLSEALEIEKQDAKSLIKKLMSDGILKRNYTYYCLTNKNQLIDLRDALATN